MLLGRLSWYNQFYINWSVKFSVMLPKRVTSNTDVKNLSKCRDCSENIIGRGGWLREVGLDPMDASGTITIEYILLKFHRGGGGEGYLKGYYFSFSHEGGNDLFHSAGTFYRIGGGDCVPCMGGWLFSNSGRSGWYFQILIVNLFLTAKCMLFAM